MKLSSFFTKWRQRRVFICTSFVEKVTKKIRERNKTRKNIHIIITVEEMSLISQVMVSVLENMSFTFRICFHKIKTSEYCARSRVPPAVNDIYTFLIIIIIRSFITCIHVIATARYINMYLFLIVKGLLWKLIRYPKHKMNK